MATKFGKINRFFNFKQKPWLVPYIDLNKKKKAASTNPFQKDLDKLSNNAFYGKTMEIVRSRNKAKHISCTEKTRIVECYSKIDILKTKSRF